MAAALRIPLLDYDTMQNEYIRTIQKVLRFEDKTVWFYPKEQKKSLSQTPKPKS